ncbi:MAG TPA: murein L,D-transpeptidase catalytic domain family protein [Caulobacteraceae bacterium]|nr:murein L,D-transpeptidase catalytic domain family protein [Caulobacteraceae bacterium]
MRFSRRGLILGGAAVVASCATTRTQNILNSASVPAAALPPVAPTVEPLAVAAAPKVVMDPKGLIRKPLLDAGLQALERHGERIPTRDAIYLVDFDRHSSKPRLYRLDLQTGEAEAFRTAHGKGSDPAHTGFAQRFSNIFDSNTSSVGAYVTAGASHGVKYAENVLLDGLEPTNSHARDRAIIVHAADYCEPSYLAQHGKLGRSYGCFSVSSQDLAVLRPAMDAGRLLFAAT